MISIEEITLLIEKLEKAKKTDYQKLIDSNLDDLKRLKSAIDEKEEETGTLLNKGGSFYASDLAEKSNNPTSPLMYKEIRDKLNKFAKTNMYNSLEIGPGNAEFSNMFVGWNKQYYVDISWAVEKKVREKFNWLHNKRHVKYIKTDGFHCGKMPTNSCNFVFSWDTFVFFTVDQIGDYLKSIHDVLIPGGYVFLQYADCHFDYDMAKCKGGYWAYNNKDRMQNLIKKHKYSVIEMGQFKPGANYAIFQKPGNVNPVVYKISEITLD